MSEKKLVGLDGNRSDNEFCVRCKNPITDHNHCGWHALNEKKKWQEICVFCQADSNKGEMEKSEEDDR